jgi:hypothetical protein
MSVRDALQPFGTVRVDPHVAAKGRQPRFWPRLALPLVARMKRSVQTRLTRQDDGLAAFAAWVEIERVHQSLTSSKRLQPRVSPLSWI